MKNNPKRAARKAVGAVTDDAGKAKVSPSVSIAEKSRRLAEFIAYEAHEADDIPPEFDRIVERFADNVQGYSRASIERTLAAMHEAEALANMEAKALADMAAEILADTAAGGACDLRHKFAARRLCRDAAAVLANPALPSAIWESLTDAIFEFERQANGTVTPERMARTAGGWLGDRNAETSKRKGDAIMAKRTTESHAVENVSLTWQETERVVAAVMLPLAGETEAERQDPLAAFMLLTASLENELRDDPKSLRLTLDSIRNQLQREEYPYTDHAIVAADNFILATLKDVRGEAVRV